MNRCVEPHEAGPRCFQRPVDLDPTCKVESSLIRSTLRWTVLRLVTSVRWVKNFKGCTAVITGGASGIGLAVARRLGEEGANIVIGDIEAEALDRAATALDNAGIPVEAVVTDVAQRDQIATLADAATARFSDIHFLHNNAGVTTAGLAEELSDTQWDWVMDVNLNSVIWGCREFLPRMKAHGQPAHIVNTASMAGHASAPLMGPYNVSKYGVVALSETLSKEMLMTKSGVGVSVLCPAFVQTAIGSSRRNMPNALKVNQSPSAAGETQSAIDRMIASGIPAADVADAVHDAVVGDMFWIITHDESKPTITERARQIVEGVNPTPTGFV